MQKLLPEGIGFQMKTQIQTGLMNTIWGPNPKTRPECLVPIPGGARGPRREPIALSRGQAGQRLPCDYPIPWGLPIHCGSALGPLNCFTARAALESAASAVCAASSRGLEHYVKATATGDRHLAIDNGQYIYVYIYIANNRNNIINNEQINNNNNNSSYVEIYVFSLRRLWAQFVMRGWSRSEFF